MFLQLIFHWLGDYILQSDYMALNKTKRALPCVIHCILYTLPFLFLLTWDIWGYEAFCFIFWSHYWIDRYSLARYLIWLKNHLAPGFKYYPWNVCSITGYKDEPLNGGFGSTVDQYCGIRPYFITIWLYIITDNGLHIICNYLAIKYL